MKPLRLLGQVFILVVAVGTVQAQQCLHGSDEIGAQKERKQRALGAVRLINTAEVAHYSRFGKFVPWEILAISQALAESRDLYNPSSPTGEAIKVISYSAESEILPGFELRLTTNGDAYSLLLRDKRDPCRFSFYSDQEGVIYYGQPIDRPPSNSPLD